MSRSARRSFSNSSRLGRLREINGRFHLPQTSLGATSKLRGGSAKKCETSRQVRPKLAIEAGFEPPAQSACRKSDPICCNRDERPVSEIKLISGMPSTYLY